MTVRFRQGIRGLLAARTRVSLFPVGYRVDVTASPSAARPGGHRAARHDRDRYGR
jgi:hypothetical protein